MAERKYDPVKRREYYLKTRELKGRGRSSRDSMLTGEDRSEIKKHDQLKKAGKTSKKLDFLEVQLIDIRNRRESVIASAIRGEMSFEDAKKLNKELEAAELKVRDDIWKEQNKLKAIKIGKDVLGEALKSEKKLRDYILNPTGQPNSFNKRLQNKDWLKKYENK